MFCGTWLDSSSSDASTGLQHTALHHVYLFGHAIRVMLPYLAIHTASLQRYQTGFAANTRVD